MTEPEERQQESARPDPLLVDAVAWALFAGEDATYLDGTHVPDEAERGLAGLFVESLATRGYAIIADPSASSPETDDDVARIREALVRDDPTAAREELRAAVDAIRADERNRASRRILDYRARHVTDADAETAAALFRASFLALDVLGDDPSISSRVQGLPGEPVVVPLGLLYRADSVCSLVAHRGLDDEARAELVAVSGKIRAITNEAERG